MLAGLGLWQASVMLEQEFDRRRKYRAASEYARSRGKPLLVVGGPLGSSPFRHLLALPAHGHGDVCLDLDPAACGGDGAVYSQSDVRNIPFPDGFFGSALVSHVMEHLPTVADCGRALDELLRVADRVYVAYPARQSLLAWIIPDHHLWVWQDNDVLIIQERPIWSALMT